MDAKEKFREWLCSEIGLQPRSAGNVISRLKRAENYIQILDSIPEEELIFRLTQVAQFKELSGCVQSQIKRAVRLYLQFLSVADDFM